MIRYPLLRHGATIGVTAPSSGVSPSLHPLLKQSCDRLSEQGFSIALGETAWTQHLAKSAPPPKGERVERDAALRRH